MAKSILLTSFSTWKPEQPSNSSDDLFDLLLPHPELPHHALYFLRKLPVDFSLAPYNVIQHIQIIQPDVVICCGMGEHRTTLDIESTAIRAEQTLHTEVNLPWLVDGLHMTHISHDAGQFVCNSLYFDVLDFIYHYHRGTPCIFVHVPRLSEKNQAMIVHDFLKIMRRVQSIRITCSTACTVA